MDEAIELSAINLEQQEGGPFGCVIVKDRRIVGRGYNAVLSHNDPTAHAEVMAIRDACQNLNTHQLTGCEVYASCEPCPMCLGAIYWARPDVVYYANTRTDAAEIGFDDAFIYEELGVAHDSRRIPFVQYGKEEAVEVFKKWKIDGNEAEY